MEDNEKKADRRSILRTTGMAIAGVTGASGTASAAPGNSNGRGHSPGQQGPPEFAGGPPAHAGPKKSHPVFDDGHPVFGDDIPEPAHGWDGKGPQSPPADLPVPDHAAVNTNRIATTEDGATIDHFEYTEENNGEQTKEEAIVVQGPDGDVAVARPKSSDPGELPDELRPNGGSS